MWWPAIGPVAIGVTGYFAPHTMGVGYENISYILSGSWAMPVVLSLCLLKFVSWSISLGSGTSGGTLAPLLTIGGAFGALLGVVAIKLFPGIGINLPTAALIGMAAMFAGASRALLTSIVFALETTGQMNGLLPLLGACVAAYFISFFLMKGSIMTEKINRRGVLTPDSYEPDVLQHASVKDLMIGTDGVTDKNGHLFIYASDDAGFAAEMMGKYNLDRLLVVESKESKKVIGTISSADIMKYYSDQKQKEHEYNSPGRTRRLMVQGRRLLNKKRS
jgi:CBS domain-containing protein